MYIDATDQAAIRLFGSGMEGPVCMLNLLRFADVADYTGFPELKPSASISGRESYQRYIDHTLPFLRATGGEIEFMGSAGHFFVGPDEEVWDLVMLIRQSSLADFLSFASNEAYLSGVGHRTAALSDSRILPVQPLSGIRIF